MVNNCRARQIEILLIEDSASDVKIISRVFERISTAHSLRVVSDGVAAIACLQQQGQYQTHPRPDLILLDLHLPKKDGLTVLQEIKSNARFANIPVIMLTASDNQKDVTECYRQEANCYLVKPSSLREFEQTVKSLQKFWLQMVRLPMF